MTHSVAFFLIAVAAFAIALLLRARPSTDAARPFEGPVDQDLKPGSPAGKPAGWAQSCRQRLGTVATSPFRASWILAGVLLGLIALKFVQEKQSPYLLRPAAVLERPLRFWLWAPTERLNDASFWGIFGSYLAAARIDRLRRESHSCAGCPQGGQSLPFGALYLGIGAFAGAVLCAAYSVFAWIEPGTFFWEPIRPLLWSGSQRRTVAIVQQAEGYCCWVAILVNLAYAGHAARLAKSLGRKLRDPATASRAQVLCKELVSACLTPVGSASVYFLAYQVIVGQGLAVDEVVALASTLLVLALPYAVVYWVSCKVGWRGELDVYVDVPGINVSVSPRRPAAGGDVRGPSA